MKFCRRIFADMVRSLRVGVVDINDRLYAVATCEVKGKLTPDELTELKEFCVGQYADGWGEGFEQRERRCADGSLYVHFWQWSKTADGSKIKMFREAVMPDE